MSPLGKAEWMVALSEVVGKRTEGEQVFGGIPVRYNDLKKRVADTVLDAPSVMLNTPYGDSWFMPIDNSRFVIVVATCDICLQIVVPNGAVTEASGV